MWRASIAAFAVSLLVSCAHGRRGAVCSGLDTGACTEGFGYRGLRIGELVAVRDSTLVLVSMSGGGTRAAAFAHGVLRGLDRLPIPGSTNNESMLDRVGVISGVSGGAFAAAHFALFGREGFGEFEKRFLFEEHLSRSLLVDVLLSQPRNLFGSGMSRSEIVIDQWDRRLFHGKTFADLERKRGAPFLLINATDLERMVPFPFVQERFDGICGDMSALRISTAVGASSAFPGLLAPVTLPNLYHRLYTDDYLTEAERSVSCGKPGFMPGGRWGGLRWAWQHTVEPRSQPYPACGTSAQIAASIEADQQLSHRYVHIADGGIADNLALCPIMDGLVGRLSLVPLRGLAGKAKWLIVIMVDAGTSEFSPSQSRRAPGAMEELAQVAGRGIGDASTSVRGAFRKDAHDSIVVATGLRKDRVFLVPITLLECSRFDEDRLRSAATTFGLPRNTVARLIELGEDCITSSPIIRRFLRRFSESGTPAECAQPGQFRDGDAHSCIRADSSMILSWATVDTASVYFSEGLSEVRAHDDAFLGVLIGWLRKNPEARIRIEGNSSEREPDSFGLLQGYRRAAAARQYFADHGVDPTRFDLLSYGDERPVCIEHKETCWEQNRRVDFRLVRTIPGQH